MSGPSGYELFSLPFALSETLILLISSFTCGLAMLAAQIKDRKRTCLVRDFFYWESLLTMELEEFTHLVHEGNSWQRSGFYLLFTLVATWIAYYSWLIMDDFCCSAAFK